MKRSRLLHTFGSLAAVLLASAAMLLGTGGAARAQLYQYGNACNDCHAMPPLDDVYRNVTTGGFRGSHSTHNPPSVAPQAVCQKCHSGSASYTTSHMDGFVNMTTNLNNSPHPGRATYNKARFFNQTSNPQLTTCSNVNCHFEKVTPVWSLTPFTSPADCSGCHGAAPNDGNHPVAGQKHATYYGTGTAACIKCHPDHTAEANPFAHATSAGKRGLILSFDASPNSGGFYSKGANLAYPNYLPSQAPVRNGSCTNLYCHSNGDGDAANTAPTWGGTLAADCTGCHGNNAGSSVPMATGKHAQHVNNAGLLGTNFECARCHSATVTAGNDRSITGLSNHVNGSKTVSFSGGGSYAGSTCSSTACHQAGKAAAPQPAAPSWSGGSLDCKGCHGAGGSFGEPSYANAGVAANLANSHVKHATSAATCSNCHNNTTLDGVSLKSGGAHLDASISVNFAAAVNRGGAAYDPAIGTKSCSNIYCHSNGSGGNPNQVPQWGGSLPGDCSGCHGNDSTSATPIVSGKHRMHLNNYTTLGRGNNFGCVECHAKTVSGNRTIASLANHANGLKDYSGARAGRITAAGSGKCSTNYCHSTGQKPAVATYWNMTGANWYSGRSLSCTGCHGNAASPEFAAVAGAPNYVNGGVGTTTANSHNRHVAGSGITNSTGCAKCHYRTVDAAVASKLRDYSTAHLNRSRDVSFSTAASIAGVQARYSTNSQQCLNTYCHGSNPSVKWGSASLACTVCHSAEVTGFTANNAGAHKMHYQVATAPVSGSYASMTPGRGSAASATSYQFTCTSCHSTPAVHAGGEAVAGAAAAQVYFGYSGGGRKGSYAYGTSQGNDNGFKWSNGTCSTTYCHSDGDGGSPNNTSFTWATPVGTLGCTGCHGSTAASGAAMDSNTHSAHMDNTERLGLGNNFSCVECHAKTVDSDTHIANKLNHVNKFKDFSGARAGGSATYAAGTCSATYCHSSGKNGLGVAPEPAPRDWTSGDMIFCDGCHGLGGGSDIGAPAYVSGAPGSAGANSHPKHVSALTITDTTGCAKCHAKTVDAGVADKLRNYSTSHLNRAINVDFAASVGGSYAAGGKTCSAVYCHSPGNKNSAYDAPNQSATWGATLACTGCHKADAASGNQMASGSHAAHVGSKLYTCNKCHAATAGSTMTIANPANHVNKAVNIAFSSSSTAVGGTYAGQATPFAKTPGTAYGSCSNVYCHSNVQNDGGTGITYRTPTWGGSVGCGSCHGDGSSHSGTAAMATGSHTKHLAYGFGATSGSVRCSICHNVGGGDYTALNSCSSMTCHDINGRVTQHVDHNVNVSLVSYFGGSYNGTAAPGDGYGACSSVYCHSDGKATPTYAPAITWGSGGRSCTSCHGSATSAGAGGSSLSGKHASHVNNPGVLGTGNSLHCIECHNATVSSDTSLASTTTHVNKMVDYTGARAGGPSRYNAITKSCSTVYCHSNGNRRALVYRSMTGSKVWTGSATLGCNGCHGNAADGTFPTSVTGAPNYPSAGIGTSTANSHKKHVYDSGITDSTGCAKCHYRTVDLQAASKLRNYSTLHLNGSPDVSFSTSASLSGVQGRYSSVSQQCLNTYCHGSGPSVKWGAASLSCNACHSANNVLPGAHQIHVQTAALATSYSNFSGNVSSSSLYRFSCSSCHKGGAGKASHANGRANVNGVAEVFFGFTSANRTGSYSYGGAGGTDNGFSYSAGGTGCQTTYCHSNGQRGAGTVNALANVVWSTTSSTGTCVQCHDTRQTGAGATTLSGKHDKHMNPTHNAIMGLGNGLSCVNCHAKTVSGMTTISDKSKHVNKFVDFSSNRGGGSSRYDASAKQCTNIYCHSNGNSAAVVYQNPAAWTSGTSYGCNGCHGTGNPATGAPDYANGGAGTATANSHAKHVTAFNITDTTGCVTCHYKTVNAGSAGKFKDYSAATYHINGARNVNFAAAYAGASFNPATAVCSNVACHSNGRGGYTNPQWGAISNCGLCHPINGLSRGHRFHMYTSASNTPSAYLNMTGNRSGLVAGSQRYNFGCSNCHPLTNATHSNGTVNLDLRNLGGVGVSRLKSLNSSAITTSGAVNTPGSGTIGTPGASVRCQNVYCHSNGYQGSYANYSGAGRGRVYALTPDWYTGSFSGDRCANCHGNSPNSTIPGTPTHYNVNAQGQGGVGGHFVGIHYKLISNKSNGLATPGTGGLSNHGNAGTSTTLNCNVCHFATVTSARNDDNVVCITCHVAGNSVSALTGNPAAIADKSMHVNGAVNVSFQPASIRSKAQMRQATFAQSAYSSVWTRNGGYKVSGAFDSAKNALNTATMWNSTTKTCSNIACHNGQSVTWSDSNGATTCVSCHTTL